MGKVEYLRRLCAWFLVEVFGEAGVAEQDEKRSDGGEEMDELVRVIDWNVWMQRVSPSAVYYMFMCVRLRNVHYDTSSAGV